MMEIAGHKIGPEEPPYIIAEISANHNGDLDKALRLIEAAKVAGASACKFQLYTPDSITINHDGPGFVIQEGPWAGRKLYDLYQEAHTPPDWFPVLFSCARAVGIQAFSSVFDKSAVDILEGLGAPAYKISSFDIQDHELIKYVGATGKPVILSTGMASEAEIAEADDILGPDRPHIFLHCVSGYPTPVSEADLGGLDRLRRMLCMDVGLSDHTLGTDVPVAAVAMGAVVIEKHLTLDRADGGPDAGFSLEPDEFQKLCESVRSIHRALHQETSPPIERVSRSLRKSLYVVEKVSAGSCLSERNVRAIRPGLGIPAKFYSSVIGRVVRVDLDYGSPVSWEDLQE